jgi:hypothetical protein
MPKEDATTVGPADQALGYLVAGGGVRRLEGGERPQSPKCAPRRRASPARRTTAAAAAARRGMVARIVGFWTLEWKVEWSSKEKCGPSKCRDGKKLGLIVYGLGIMGRTVNLVTWKVRWAA